MPGDDSERILGHKSEFELGREYERRRQQEVMIEESPTMTMRNYDVVVYMRGREPHIVKTMASTPVIAFDIAINQARDWPSEEQALVVGVTLKVEKKEGL